MTLIDLRASALNVTGYPGNAHTITLTWPAGTLDGTTWAATVGGEPVDSVTVDGDDLVVALTIPETVGGYELLLIQTDVDAVKAAGRVRSTETPTTDTDSTNLTVTLSTAEGSVTVVGTGPAGPGGGGGVTDGDKGDVVVSGGVWSLEDGVVTPAKLSFDPATQAELNSEATTRANADTALDGRLDTVEATLPTKADLVAGVVPDGQLPAGLTRDVELVAYVDSAIDALLDGAPGALDTLNELAAAIGDDASFAATVTTSLAGKQAAAAELTVLSGLSSTALGRTLLTIASEAAARTAIGLGNVDNTADLAKPISTATQTALDTKAPTASPALTGNPTAPTQTAGNDSTRIATTAFVKGAVDSATSAAVPKALVDAKGDLLAASAADTVGRLAVGTDGQVLTADAAQALGVKWATPSTASAGAAIQYRYTSGLRYTPAGGHGGGSAYANERAFASYLPTDDAVVIDAIGLRITVAGNAGAVWRLGIAIPGTGNRPTTYFLKCGTLDASSTGYKEIDLVAAGFSAGQRTLPAGGVFIVSRVEGASTTAPQSMQLTSGIIPLAGRSTSQVADAAAPGYRSSTTGSGEFGASWDGDADIISSVPKIWVKVA